jgi:hypothetical protein
MQLLPGLKRRPRTQGNFPEDSGKWGWYIMAVAVVLWLVYAMWFDN